MEYKDLLNRAQEKADKENLQDTRFKLPEIDILNEGNKTIVKNFSNITDSLRRDSGHLLKFFQRELATPGQIINNRLILERKLNKERIMDKLEEYVNKYVLCPACNKPDT
ncbi:MAG: translation initiation factor IF-2 subunit beta, partial [Candidatus Aenigmatarchaeota archaeon]